MTIWGKYLVRVISLALLVLASLIGVMTSCRTAAPSTATTTHAVELAPTPYPPSRPTAILTTTQTRPAAPTLLALASPTVGSATVLVSAPVSVTQAVTAALVPMTSALAVAQDGTLPTTTISLATLLSQTIEVQANLSLSMATVAQSLAALVPPPLTTTVALSQAPLPTGTLPPTVTPSVAPTLPLPVVVDAAPPLTLTAPNTPTSPLPAPASAAELPADGEVRRAYVPILMYHYLSVPPAGSDIYRRDLSVTPEQFAAHLDRLQAEGYTTISLYTLHAYLTQGVPLPPKPVILTFDDGYRDNYEQALPLLVARKLTATFFIVTEFIDRERPEYLSWAMVRELYTAGMSIEAHGVDHTTLRGRSQADLEYQALRSYETIQDRIGARPRFISYPAGEYDAATIAMFQSAGYWAGFTTVQGATHRSDELFTIHRVRIRSSTTPDELIKLLTVDW